MFKLRSSRRTTFDTWRCHVRLKDGRSTTIEKEGGFCADPFLLRKDLVLFEFYSFSESRGWIEAFHLDTGQSYKVFDNGGHSSFPFVFSMGGISYVMPEQREFSVLEVMPIVEGQDGRICVSERQAIQLCTDVPIVDAMLLKHDGELLCLYNEDVGRIGDPGGTLLMARARLAAQGLDVHEATVISSDFRTARNAGSAWSKRGAIYRVFQRKLPAGYGNGIGVERIRLGPERSEVGARRDIICPPFFKDQSLNRLSHHLDIKPFGMVWDARPNKGDR